MSNKACYASVCANVLHLGEVWGWPGLEKKFNPNANFKQVHLIGFNNSFRYRSFSRGTLLVHAIPRPRLRVFRFPLISIALLVRYAVKIIHEYNIRLLVQFYNCLIFSGLPTVLAGKIGEIPTIVTVQNEYDHLSRTMGLVMRISLYNQFIEKYIYRAATHIRCVSPHLVDYVKARGGQPEKISFIPRCIDLSTFSDPDDREKSAFRKQYDLDSPEDKLTILVVGKLTPQKNHNIALQALALLKQQNIRFQLLLAGSGPLENDLRRTAKDLGIAGAVKFLGKIPQQELRCAYAISDIFLLPTLFEGRSRAILEALSYGLPVVGSNIPSVKSVIQDNVNGFLVDPRDPQSIAGVLIRMNREPELRKKISANARENFKENYAVEECYARKATLLLDLMA